MKQIYGIICWFCAIAIGFSIVGGLPALKLFLILSLIFALPTYLLVSSLLPYVEESVLISLLLSLGIIPSLTYFIGFLIGIQAAAIVSALLLVLLGFGIRFLKKKKSYPKAAE